MHQVRQDLRIHVQDQDAVDRQPRLVVVRPRWHATRCERAPQISITAAARSRTTHRNGTARIAASAPAASSGATRTLPIANPDNAAASRGCAGPAASALKARPCPSRPVDRLVDQHRGILAPRPRRCRAGWPGRSAHAAYAPTPQLQLSRPVAPRLDGDNGLSFKRGADDLGPWGNTWAEMLP